MTNPEELQNIIEALGRKDLAEGYVRGTHLGKILQYLQMKRTERYEDTLYKLALVLGMNIRYIRENYLKGLELFGVIKTRMEKNDLIWNWCGDRCFNNGDIKSIKGIEQTEKEEKKK
jgi:hypothetical protein